MKASEAFALSKQSRLSPLREDINKAIRANAEKSNDNNCCALVWCDMNQFSLNTLNTVVEELREDGYKVQVGQPNEENNIELYITWYET